MRVGSIEEAARLKGTAQTVTGTVTEYQRSFYSVDIGVPAHMPVERAPQPLPEDRAALVGHQLELEVYEVSMEPERVWVGRVRGRDELDESEPRRATLRRLRRGQVLDGRVQSIVAFGAFVDIGGVHGLVHHTEMDRPVERGQVDQALTIGQPVKVEVLDFVVEAERVSLRLVDTP